MTDNTTTTLFGINIHIADWMPPDTVLLVSPGKAETRIVGDRIEMKVLEQPSGVVVKIATQADTEQEPS